MNNRLNPWAKGREMPAAPKQSFRDWYKQNRKP
jgi:L-lactate dehydrogenase complex protein LldF